MELKRDRPIIEISGNPNRTIALNVFVSLYQLNEWARERGDLFHIRNEGVPWIDERGWNNVIGSPPEIGFTVEPCPDPTSRQDSATPAPVADGCALGKPDKAGPVGVETRAMADSFAGLRWTGKQWIKKFGDKPAWLAGCIVLNRARGEGQRQWNPVLIGAYLARMGHAKPNSIRAKFQTQPALQPWLDD